MTETKQTSIIKTDCRPDCVTEIRMGNSVLAAFGFLKQGAINTAVDEMVKVLETEAATQKTAIRPTIKKQIRRFCCYTDNRPMWYNRGTE